MNEKVLYIRAGRGNSGGTTALNASIENAIIEGRDPVILDAARNPSLANLYPSEAIRPASHAIGDVKEAITTEILDAMIEGDRSGVIDLGGGQDDTLVEYMLDLDLAQFGKDVGIRVVFLVCFGPQMDDFDHALEVKRRGVFDGANVLLVQNEGVLKRGQDPGKMFGAIIGRKEFLDWLGEGARSVYLPTLACMPDIRQAGITLREAANRKGSLGPTKSYMVDRWLKGWNKSYAENNCEGWRI